MKMAGYQCRTHCMAEHGALKFKQEEKMERLHLFQPPRADLMGYHPIRAPQPSRWKEFQCNISVHAAST